ncbi:MAG: cysteine synthase A [Gammaproteobacteria bacterium]|nr:MAG: cysteine synthase A [Gammaproteobacteria bacterium]
MKIFSDNSMSIGNTPLVRLNKIGFGNIIAKIEGRNPAYSIKCRVGANMIWDAEKRGVLNTGMTIIEPTSGNTGIALAYAGAARGYKVKLVMPESMSIERRKVMLALGAELELTDASLGMKGAIDKAEEFVGASDDCIMLQQFTNPANPEIHEKTTGPEIWADTDGNVDIFVAGVGTGGTISGSSRFLKSKKAITTIAVEPEASPIITQTLNGQELTPAPHKIQGIGAGFIAENLDLSIIDAVEKISNDDAMEYAHRLMKEEGILAGISGGAAVAAAARVAARDENREKMIVVILPDSGERYLSTALFE